MEFVDYLKYMVEKDGSDLYLSTYAPPSVKINGRLSPIHPNSLPPGQTAAMAKQILSNEQWAVFEKHSEMNLALTQNGIGRFRVNVFRQKGEVGLVIRCIKTTIPSMGTLGIPDILRKLIMEKRGLILFVGATGSGKTTSLASLIDYRNRNNAGHIITIEDPIEFIHEHKKSIMTQREVGLDTESYTEALKNTLRQAPDVILIGEIRSQETMEHAISFAETGHLCLSTLHSNNANQALDRIINFFPPTKKNQILLDVSLNIRGIISQRLIPAKDGTRTASFEILLGTPYVSELIRRGEITELKDVMEKSENLGMMTFDTSLFHLYEEGKITLDEALKNADSQNNLRLRIQLKESNAQEIMEKTELTLKEESGEGGLR